MMLLATHTVDHGGREFEVRIFRTSDGYSVAGFRAGRLASPWVYFATLDVCCDMRCSGWGEAVDWLIHSVVCNIRNDRWEELCEFYRSQGLANPLLS